ncbi:hypothetical protein B0T25DRAFT_554239 [Lasiosphaeria hispida]|uniref:Uncharacterized protein n=1 Tax=Lasiosphaeria hispida TaxID=260671 RepID=A0AAJ0M9C0_9PEZI|nr:hypothetical protein B0T25DRAFT_554239 [Lasiosphaeria hispida]
MLNALEITTSPLTANPPPANPPPATPLANPLPTTSLPATPPAMSPIQISYVGGYADALEAIGLASGYVGEDGEMGFENMSAEDHQAATTYLSDKFGVYEFYICGTFCVLLCDDNTAVREGRLPILVGGVNALWREEMDGDFPPMIGDPACGREIKIDRALIAAAEPLEPPLDQIIQGLATYVFTDCEAMTWLHGSLIVELPEMDKDEFLDRLNDLPSSIAYLPYNLEYHNGPLAKHEQRKRVVIPTPQHAEDKRAADETDYVNLDGRFYPGSMLYSIDDSENKAMSEVTAGVLIRKGAERRLTSAWHAWAPIYEKNKDLLGKDTDEAKRTFRVIQGTNPGTNVGYVKERVGNTGIALIQLHDGVIFENTFLGGNFSARRFVHSQHVKHGDKFMIDGFTTGQQDFSSNGARYPVSRPGDLIVPQGEGKGKGDLSLQPEPNVAYITGRQGVSATQMPTLRRGPFIRDSVCGAVWLRIKKQQAKELDQQAVMELGEVFAMCHYADLTSKYTTAHGVYMMYADTFDPLIKENWTIVPKEGVTEELNTPPPHPRPTTEDSPSKRPPPR